MSRRIGILSALAILALCAPARAQQVEFNYNGRVKVQGQTFTGEGLFKFALMSPDNQITYWANDGLTFDGSEPTSSIAADMVDGFFSVNIGDTSIPNMAPLEASIFNDRDRVFLRVWFSDQQSGFEQLNPDCAVVNPALLGMQSFEALDIYVDPANGDDGDTGLRSNKPKKTIQAAWDALPAVIHTTATIHLAQGIYRESVLLTGKNTVGTARAVIAGTAGNPSNARITGADAGAETTPVRDYGFHVVDQKHVLITDVLLDYFATSAVQLESGAEVTIQDSLLLDNDVGLEADRSVFAVVGGEIRGLGPAVGMGIRMQNSSNGRLERANIHDVYAGVWSIGFSNMGSVKGSNFSDCVEGFVISLSTISFEEPMNTMSNCSIAGVRASYNSLVYSANSWVTYTNVAQDVDLLTTSYVYNR